ncbi:hypothetical protein AS29_020450 [Bacillus sp. SJS]|nr:hypothetical protein AS29_020450 [Bacillus sp. SJS]
MLRIGKEMTSLTSLLNLTADFRFRHLLILGRAASLRSAGACRVSPVPLNPLESRVFRFNQHVLKITSRL